MSLTELANETGLHKTTVLRLTNSLALYGFIQRNAKGLFSVGPSVWQLGLLFRRDYLSREAVMPALLKLVEFSGESASFYVRAGEQRVCLYRENSPNRVRVHVDEGIRLNLSTGASGRVLRYFSGDDSISKDEFNQNGSTHSVAESLPDISSIATPVFSNSGELLGALVVSGLRTRFDREARERTIPVLEEAARSLRQ